MTFDTGRQTPAHLLVMWRGGPPSLLICTCWLLLRNVVLGMSGTRMLEPPSRASLWRYGYSTPTNLLDGKTDCGGYDVHYNLNNGTCGVCGDPSNEPTPRNHEAGGKFSPSPTPVRSYRKGGYVTVVMETTGLLLGKYEFRICSISDNMATPEQACFDRILLTILESEQGTSYMIGSRQGIHTLNVQLPQWLTCAHCILQWRHVTGFKINQETSSCYTCPPGGEQRCHACLGCGKQVWYTGCTDIAIYDYAQGVPPPAPAGNSTTTTAGPATGEVCPPCFSSVDSTNNVINASKPYTSPSFADTSPLPAPQSMPPTKPTPSAYDVIPSRSIDILSTPTTLTYFKQQQLVTRSMVTNENRLTFLASTITTPKATPSPKPSLLLKRTFPVPITSTVKPTSSSTATSQPSKPPIFCYVTNRNRHPKLTIDNWCGHRCPYLGNSICLFKLCMPVSCKTVKNQPTSSPSSTTRKHTPTTRKHTLTTNSTTSGKLLPPTYVNSVQEIPSRDSGRPNYPKWGENKQAENSNRQTSWNWMSLMSYFMLSGEM